MKQFMTDHVSAHQNGMFQDATAEVKKNLDTMCEQVKTTMRGRVEAIFDVISRDYMMIVGGDANKNRALGKVEKLARAQVNRAIAQSELLFGEVLEGDSELLDGAGLADVYRGTEEDEFEVEGEDASVPLVNLASEDVDEREDDEESEAECF